jgi:hypothetical protein
MIATAEAMLRVALPVDVERELNEGAKALLTFAQLFLDPPQLSDVLQDAKLAQRLHRPSNCSFEPSNPGRYLCPGVGRGRIAV